MKISVVINTYNSERFLPRVLESVKEFDEIVICDMHSTDSTLELAEKYQCKVVFCEKHDFVEPVRNFAIHAATHEWVLVVDSDEVVPEALRRYLYRRIQNPDCPEGLWIPRKNYIMGRFMHGNYPDHILRFFRKENTYWPPYVHVTPIIKGKIERISKRKKELAFVHLVNNSVGDRIRKFDIYTNNEVQKRANQSFSYYKMCYAPVFRFLKTYFIRGGFRDGRAGLVNAYMEAIYKFVTIAKVWESRVNPEDFDEELKV